jgi:monovalent cation:H+ antiporter-2, CPA2 family
MLISALARDAGGIHIGTGTRRMEHQFAQILLLLGIGVAVVLIFQRLHIPSSLGYLLVGLILGPHTPGPIIQPEQIQTLADFGIVFLLFTIGLSFSLPQIHALRHQVLGLGTGQVVLTTAIVGLLAWLAGLSPAAAFVIGAVFAQSSTTIISKQLLEQGEENTRHGRLGTAMSVFQDVTAVPFVVIIPVLGTAAGAAAIAGSLGWAMVKVVLAFALLFVVGRRLLRPLFHLVAERRSAEVFTLTVLFVSLIAAWLTHSLGLSMAFGAFLAGMMLGETEFRHQVEATIRPFRDVLLGLFFVAIGMLFDPASGTRVWAWAVFGTVVLLSVKAMLVAGIVRWSGVDTLTAWRTGLLLAVGGEFGFALVSIALLGQTIDDRTAQIALTTVLLSMIVAPFFIRYNRALATLLTRRQTTADLAAMPDLLPHGGFSGHVIICGYGRIGQSVAHFLEKEQIPFVALDLDPSRIRDAHRAGEPAFYGDASDRHVLETVGIHTARLVIISHEDLPAARKILQHVRHLQPDLPVMVRTRDESHVEELRAAGATEIVPETLEASLMIASQALLLLNVPVARVMRRMQEQRSSHYLLLREFFRGDEIPGVQGLQQPVLVQLAAESPSVGRSLGEFATDDVVVTALVREGHRKLSPAADTLLEAGDVLVLFGDPEDLAHAERALAG